MFLKSYRRTPWRRSLRTGLYLIATVVLLDLFRILGAHNTFQRNLLANTISHYEDLPRAVQNQKIYVTAQFWTSEWILAVHWIDAFLRLVHTLGPENIYVSILSSSSLDNTDGAVRYLESQLAELGVERTVILDPTTHESAISAGPEDASGNPRPGWVTTHDTDSPIAKELRRIPYLSDIRNKGLEPLLRMHRKTGRTFDRILHLNDVVFEPKDILSLLATNAGNFDVACGLDYSRPPVLYDTFAVRDMSFRGPVMSTFPFFNTPSSRDAMLAGLPTPVTSCWNGIIAVDAAPYYDQPMPGHPHRVQKGLRFRGVPDSLAAYYLEASECCLIHADLLASGQAHRGIYINPAVRTGYEPEAYQAVHFGPLGSNFVSAWQYLKGVWAARLSRWEVDGVSSSAGQHMAEVYKRINIWEEEGRLNGQAREELGGYCTILEMHIMIWNGWKHVWKDVGKEKLKRLGIK